MKQKKFPWLTIALAVTNLAIWALFLRSDEQRAANLIDTLAFTPARLTYAIAHHDTAGIAAETLRSGTSIFIHEHDAAHVIWNMAFLLLLGLAVEKRLGLWRYALLYLGAGLVTSLVYWGICPDGLSSFGASSAVCGVMGAFIILCARERPVMTLIPVGCLALTVIGAINPNAVAATGFGMWAHMSGFMIGMLGAALMTLEIRPARLPK